MLSIKGHIPSRGLVAQLVCLCLGLDKGVANQIWISTCLRHILHYNIPFVQNKELLKLKWRTINLIYILDVRPIHITSVFPVQTAPWKFPFCIFFEIQFFSSASFFHEYIFNVGWIIHEINANRPVHTLTCNCYITHTVGLLI